MGKLGSLFSLKFRLHPIMIPFLFLIVISGEIAYYAFIFGSLIVHEIGHLIAAKMAGIKVRSCTVMPYGGEIYIVNRQSKPPADQLMVIMGGPIATSILLFASLLLPIPEQPKLVTIQCVLLLMNLLPILPLDGGQALTAIMSMKNDNYTEVYEKVLQYSVLSSCALMLFLISKLPDMLPFFLLMLFIFVQNYLQWRHRKYRIAFNRMVNNQLTR